MANCQCSSGTAIYNYTSEGNMYSQRDCWPTAAEALSAGSSFWVNHRSIAFPSGTLCRTSLFTYQAAACANGPSGYAFEIRACASASPVPKGLCCTFSLGTTNATDTYGCFGPTTKSSCFANNGFKWNQLGRSPLGNQSSCHNNWCAPIPPPTRPSFPSPFDCCNQPTKAKVDIWARALNGCIAPYFGPRPQNYPAAGLEVPNGAGCSITAHAGRGALGWMPIVGGVGRGNVIFDPTKYTRVNFAFTFHCGLENFSEPFYWIYGNRPCGTSNLPGQHPHGPYPVHPANSSLCRFYWSGGSGLTVNQISTWDKGSIYEVLIDPSAAGIQCGDRVFAHATADKKPSCFPYKALGAVTLLAGTPKCHDSSSRIWVPMNYPYSSSSRSAWYYFYKNITCTSLGSQCAALASTTPIQGAPCCVPPIVSSSGYCVMTDSLTCVRLLAGTYFPSLSSCRYKMCDSLLAGTPSSSVSSSSPEVLGRAHYFAEYNCKDINTLAPDVVCDTAKRQFLKVNRHVLIRESGFPKNGGNTCAYNPAQTFHFVINYGSSSCNLYIHEPKPCESQTPLNLNNRNALDHCCECNRQSCFPYPAANSSLASKPSIKLRPGRYCFHQNFYVWPFFSAPTKKNYQAMNDSTTCEQADSCGATYKHPTPGYQIISIRVPRLLQEADVKGKWIALDPKHSAEKYKFYKIDRPVGGLNVVINPSLIISSPVLPSSQNPPPPGSSGSSGINAPNSPMYAKWKCKDCATGNELLIASHPWLGSQRMQGFYGHNLVWGQMYLTCSRPYGLTCTTNRCGTMPQVPPCNYKNTWYPLTKTAYKYNNDGTKTWYKAKDCEWLGHLPGSTPSVVWNGYHNPNPIQGNGAATTIYEYANAETPQMLNRFDTPYPWKGSSPDCMHCCPTTTTTSSSFKPCCDEVGACVWELATQVNNMKVPAGRWGCQLMTYCQCQAAAATPWVWGTWYQGEGTSCGQAGTLATTKPCRCQSSSSCPSVKWPQTTNYSSSSSISTGPSLASYGSSSHNKNTPIQGVSP